MEYWIQRVTIYAVIGGGILLALYAGISAGDSDLTTVLTMISVLLFFFIYFGVYRYYWLLTLITVFIPGNLNFIPAGLQAFEVLLMLGTFRFFFDQVIFGAKRVRVGPRYEFICITVLVGILFYHGLGDRFGMRVLGSSSWGGRAYVGVIFGYLAYLIFQTISFDLKVWKWFPLFCFLPAIIDAGIKLLTKLVPSTAYMIYPIYGGVSVSVSKMAIDASFDFGGTQVARMGEFASIGAPLLLLVLSYCHLKHIWRPQNWVFLGLLCLACLLAVLGTYRSSVLGMMCIMMAAGFRDFRFAVWMPATVVAFLLAGLIAYHSYGGWQMPLGAQRALVFLPGKWDQAAVDSASGSDEFRFETWQKWETDHFEKHPFIGRGFGFDAAVMSEIQNAFDRQDDLLMREALLLSGEIHNGFLSVVDRTGILGALFFLFWWGLTLYRIFMVLYDPDFNNFSPALLWCALYLSSSTALYVVGSLRFDSFFPEQIVFCGLMVRLMREAKEKKLMDQQDAARVKAIAEAQAAVPA